MTGIKNVSNQNSQTKTDIKLKKEPDYIENYIHQFFPAGSLLVGRHMRHMRIPVLNKLQLHIHNLLRIAQRLLPALHRIAPLRQQTPRCRKRYIRYFLLIQLHPPLSGLLHLVGAAGKLINAASMLVVADVLLVVDSVLKLCADIVHQLLV